MNYTGMACDFLLAHCRGITLSSVEAEKKVLAVWEMSIEKQYFLQAFTILCSEGKAVFDHGNEIEIFNRFYYIYTE